MPSGWAGWSQPLAVADEFGSSCVYRPPSHLHSRGAAYLGTELPRDLGPAGGRRVSREVPSVSRAECPVLGGLLAVMLCSHRVDTLVGVYTRNACIFERIHMYTYINYV